MITEESLEWEKMYTESLFDMILQQQAMTGKIGELIMGRKKTDF
jgi:hypothetical protein